MSFWDFFLGTKPKIETETINDPAKTGVANQLSSYLSSQIGQGVPLYGKQILSDLPEGGGASLSDFLKLNAEDSFNSLIKNPAVASFKNNYSQLLEGSAGALSSSGRAYNDNTAVTNLELGLAEKKAAWETGLPAAQLAISSGIKEQVDKEKIAQYQDWLKSLPQYNPALEQGIKFLQESTNTGNTILSYLNPGSKGLLYDMLTSFAKGVGQAAGAGAGGG